MTAVAMPMILRDAFLLQLLIPRDLPDAEVAAARRILDGKSFRTRLRKAAEAVLREYPELARIAPTLSR